jgi:hypothetical protein
LSPRVVTQVVTPLDSGEQMNVIRECIFGPQGLAPDGHNMSAEQVLM